MTTPSCATLWNLLSAAKAKEDAFRAAIEKGKKEKFDQTDFEKLEKETSHALDAYQHEATKLVDLGDGRLIQQRDYLALRRFWAGCIREDDSALPWSIVLNENVIDISDDTIQSGRVVGLDLREEGLARAGDLSGLSALLWFDLHGNKLTAFTVPDTLTALRTIFLSGNEFTALTVPDTLTSLQRLYLGGNKLIAFTVPETFTALQELSLNNNQLTDFIMPDTLTALQWLELSRNQLTTFTIPETLTALQKLDLYENKLTAFTVPDTLPALYFLLLSSNPQLTSVSIPNTLPIRSVVICNCPKLDHATRDEASRRGWRLQ